VPERITVAPDTRYYVMEKPERGQRTPPNPNQVAVQIHRWVDFITKNPEQKTEQIPVGDWVIADWVLVNRGERLNQIEPAEVPAYDPISDSFFLISPAKNAPTKKIRVVFGPLNEDILLVDVEGGTKQTYQRPGGEKLEFTLPREALILGADGSLELHNQDFDSADKEREARHKSWEEWINKIKRSRIPALPGGGMGGRGGSGGS
jgi:hypothetical protein